MDGVCLSSVLCVVGGSYELRHAVVILDVNGSTDANQVLHDICLPICYGKSKETFLEPATDAVNISPLFYKKFDAGEMPFISGIAQRGDARF